MSRTPRLALASCRGLLAWEVDDHPLIEALEARGAAVERPAWDASDVDWSSFDAVLIRTTWDYMHRRDEFVAWAHHVASVGRLFNPAGVIAWNTDKSYLRELESRGARIAPTLWLKQGTPPADLAGRLHEQGWTRAFIKPRVGASALGTLRFDVDPSGIAAAEAHLATHLAEGAMLIQPYLSSVETFGELSALFFDGQLSHGVRKVPVAGDYRVQDDYGAKDTRYAFEGAERTLVETLATLTDHDLLYARVDLLRDDEGQLVLNELELVEPSLFLRGDRAAAERLAEAFLARL